MQGVAKPLYLNASLSLDPKRWAAFLPKVLHVTGNASSLGGEPRTAGLQGRRALEIDMRAAPVAAFLASSDPRAVRACLSTCIFASYPNGLIASSQCVCVVLPTGRPAWQQGGTGYPERRGRDAVRQRLVPPVHVRAPGTTSIQWWVCAYRVQSTVAGDANTAAGVRGPRRVHRVCVAFVSLLSPAPCTSYKLSTEWVQETYDRVGLGPGWVASGALTSKQLSHFVWAPGPTILALPTVLGLGRLPRYDV